MKKRHLIPIIPAAAAASVAFATPAFAASQEAVSENWAGYEASTSSGADFSAVSGGWTEPAVNCSSGQTTYSAYWVGLGGASQNSDALEQVGTQSDCDASGSAADYAWYELVPKAPVKIPMTVNPGDKMWARTAVSGDQVTVYIKDETTGATFTKTLTMSNPDTSSAEWIAEAPSECQGGATGNCSPLPLSDFGTVKFTDSHATSNGKVGSISSYDSTAVALESGSSSMYGGGGGYNQFSGYGTSSGSQSSGAAPGSLSSDGTGFSVTYGAEATSSASDTGDGYGDSSGYGSSSGYGDSSGYGSSSGYGDSSGYGYGYGGGGYGGGGSGYVIVVPTYTYGSETSSTGAGSSYGYLFGY